MAKAKDKREYDEHQEGTEPSLEPKHRAGRHQSGTHERGSEEHEQKLKEQIQDQKHLEQLEKEHKRLEKLKAQDERAWARNDADEKRAETREEMARIRKEAADRNAKDREAAAVSRVCARNLAEIKSIGNWQDLGRDVASFLGGRQHGWDRASTGDMDRSGGGYTDMGRGTEGRSSR